MRLSPLCHRSRARGGFTLIELLTVVAIIGILASILIPTVGAVRNQAKKAASKSQLNQYVNAIQMFESEYGYYPTFGQSGGGSDITVDLSNEGTSTQFIETLSGRDANSGERKAYGGNRKAIQFHDFAEGEFAFKEGTDERKETQLADRFNNTNIQIMIDADGDGRVKPSPDCDKVSGKEMQTPVTAWVESNEEDAPCYALWQ